MDELIYTDKSPSLNNGQCNKFIPENFNSSRKSRKDYHHNETQIEREQQKML